MLSKKNAGVRKVVLVSFITVSMLAFVVAPALTVVAQEVVESTPTPLPAVVLGCMNSAANNYNPDATEDDGSCVVENPTPTPSDTPVSTPDATPSDTPAPTPTFEPSAVVAPTPAPVLTTDKEDYHPGETANIFGSFFGALQDLVLKVFGSDKHGGNYTESTQTVTTDENGYFDATYTLDNLFRPFYEMTVSTLDGILLATGWFRDSSIGTYDQCSNDVGIGYATGDTGCRWVNGNLQPNNSKYFEHDATVQRLWLDGLDVNSIHTVTFKYGTTKGGKHAYDYLTKWDHSEGWITLADLCQDIDDCTGASVPVSAYTIPDDSNVSNLIEPLGSPVRDMVMRGGTITGITAPAIVSGDYTGDSETVITVSFTVDPTDGANDMCITSGGGPNAVTSCGVAFFFGAHVSAQEDWGIGNSAVNISGSPYHVALDAIDGVAVGQRDNQMQSATVVQNASITIVKDAVPDHEQNFSFTTTGTGLSSFSLDDDADGTLSNTQVFNGLAAGTYTVTEAAVSGWSLTGNATCTDATSNSTINLGTGVATINLAAGENVTCTFVNTLQQAHLTLLKTVDNDNGGTALDTAWTLSASGPTPISGVEGNAAVTNAAVNAGVYNLSESAGPAGYTNGTAWVCSGGTQNDGDTVTLVAGQSATCTITNTDNAPSLTLVKVVDNDNGGTAVASSWTLTASGPTGFSGVGPSVSNGASFDAGTYALSESAALAGYTNGTAWVCVGGTQGDATHVTVALGESATCTIHNTDNAPSLTLVKVVDHNYGGTAEASSWTLTATGPTGFSGAGPSVSNGVSFDAGTYDLSESAALTGYTNGTAWVCVGGTQDDADTVTLGLGQSATCTIHNADQPGHLIVHKVTNPTDTTTEFSVTAIGGTIVTPTATQTIVGGGTVDYTVYAGTYNVSEADLAGWDETGNTCVDVSVANGETKECTITNTQRGHVIIEKNAIPDSNTQSFTFHNNFGNGNLATFSLTDTTAVGLPNYNAEVLPGEYVVTEDEVSGWQLNGTTCDMGETVDDIDVGPGETVTCTFTNQKLAEIILVKNTVGGDDTFDFSMTGATLPSSAQLTTAGGTDSEDFTNINPNNTYSITETPIPAGWAQTGATCDNGDPVTAITPNSGEVITCTFTNNKPAAQIDVTPLTDTNKIGDNHVIGVDVQVHNGDGVWGPAADGTVVTFSITNTPGATATFVSGDTCATIVGVCSVTINSPTAGHVVVNASAGPVVLGVTVNTSTGTGGLNSADAQKDYVNARISIATSATNEVDDAHIFTVTVEQSVEDGVWTPVVGAVVDATSNPVPGTFDESDCTSGTDVLGQCTVTINSSSAGVFTVDASTNISVNTVAFNLTTDGVGENSDSAIKTYVDANIQITPNEETNEVGDDHVFTGHVNVNNGSGWDNAPAGTQIDFTKVSGPGALSASSCLTIGVTGSCTVTLTSATTGTTIVKAGTSVVVGGVTLDRETGDSLAGDSASAIKHWADLQITIDQNSTNEIGQAHTFAVTVKKDIGDGAGWVDANVETVVPSITGAGSLTGTGTCETGTTVNGQCTIIVTSSVAGVGTVDATVTVDINGASITRELGDNISADSAEATKTWVDAKISIGQDGVNEINDPHTFTGHVDVNNGSVWANAPDGTTINFSIASGPGSLDFTSCLTTGGTGSCSVMLSSVTVGTTVVNASVDDIDVGGVLLDRTTNGLAGNSGPATKKWVDAKITITPDKATNPIHSAHVFTVTVTQYPGTATPAATADVTTNVNPTPDLTNTTTCDSAVAFVANVATCTITINSSAPAVFTASATAVMSVGGVSLTRSTDGLANNSGPAEKTYEAGSLEVTKVVELGNVVNPSAIDDTFTVTVTGPSYPTGHDIQFNLVDGVLEAPTTVTLSPLIPGNYTVTEADAGTEWSEVVATSPVTVVANDVAGVTVTNTYVPGSLNVTKALVLGGYALPVNGSFEVVVTGPSYPSGTTLTFTVINGVVSGTQTIGNLIPGTYTVTETNPGIAWTVTGGGNVTVNSGTPAGQSTVTNTLKQPHTTISMTPSTSETEPGENVVLTITDTNDGAVPLTNPTVTLTYGSTTVTLDKLNYYVTGDTDNDGVMDVGEAWTWSYSVLISENTTFNIAGHGLDPLGNDISPQNGYTTEAGLTTVKVIGTTRTLGYWQTHTSFTTYVYTTFGGITVGNNTNHKGPIDTIGKVFGGFYAPIAKTSTGGKRTPVDQARIILLQQLLAAKLNCMAFNCSGTVQGQITAADLAYAANDKNAIMSFVSILDAFNNSGDANAIPSGLPSTGKATPSVSKAQATIGFWDQP